MAECKREMIETKMKTKKSEEKIDREGYREERTEVTGKCREEKRDLVTATGNEREVGK